MNTDHPMATPPPCHAASDGALGAAETRGADGHLRLAMLCDALSDAVGLARIRLQSIVASLRRKTSILFQIKRNDIGAPSLGGRGTGLYVYCCDGAPVDEARDFCWG